MAKTHRGGKVGPGMKGLLIDGDSIVWDVDSLGEPHHGDIDEDGGDAQLSFIDGYIDFRSFGYYIPFEIKDILRWFSEFSESSPIEVQSIMYRWGGSGLSFNGTVSQLRRIYKNNPPPHPDEYEEGIDDAEFRSDMDKWGKSIDEKKTARDVMGRGGRDDSWQEKDEDWSKGFSVYNNPDLVVWKGNKGSIGKIGRIEIGKANEFDIDDFFPKLKGKNVFSIEDLWVDPSKRGSMTAATLFMSALRKTKGRPLILLAYPYEEIGSDKKYKQEQLRLINMPIRSAQETTISADH